MSTISNFWNIEAAEFPQSGTPTEQLKFLLNYALLAPSGHNTQPWNFKIQDEAIALYADRTRALPVVDPQDRELIISCGTALFNLRIALRHFGYTGKISTFPEPSQADLLATIQLGKPTQASADEQMLFEAIPQRHTNRRDYENRDVPKSMLTWLQVDAASEGAWLHVVKGDLTRQAIAELVVRGDRWQMANPDFRRELAAWIHPGSSSSHDGIPGYAYGVNQYLDFATPIFAWAMRTLDLGDAMAHHNRQLTIQSPAILVLGTEQDTPRDWLAAGQALERVLLRSQAVGLSASFLNQPIEVPTLRSQLSKLIYASGYPQILLRLGFGSEVKPTARRGIDEVLL
ncbi:nitroreductase [Chroococcidiopsis sp. CCNUC1]|jgi:hypothetical protein|uniref:Acg family FMN-binding oxidoreductase n=1 Tax=Chroococcidiopsis sp. CCNUC1 TaxID=2653189 RepID=UPI0020206D24|nr:nitroreductase [Chroococcidiopsis sp. CCNUC1]URD49182.1 nitroreductase [Chroococcidiopsis sp. CCNUC1]